MKKIPSVLSIIIIASLIFPVNCSIPLVHASGNLQQQTSETNLENLLKDFTIILLKTFFFFSNTEENVPTVSTIPHDAVSISISYPETKTLIAGATNVLFLTLTINNGTSENTELRNIAFLRKGIGTREDFENVFFSEGGKRITSVTNVNSENMAIFRLNLRPIVILQNETKTIELRANLSDTQNMNGHENTFVIIPETLEMFTQESNQKIAPQVLSTGEILLKILPLDTKNTLRMKNGPSISNNTFLALNLEDTFGYFTFESESSEDIIVQNITLKVSKHAQVLKNLILEEQSSRSKICKQTYIDATENTVTFTCDNGYILPRSSNRIISIKGSLELGYGIVSALDTLSFSLDDPGDVVAQTQSGMGVRVIDEL